MSARPSAEHAELIDAMLRPRLEASELEWLDGVCGECAAGVSGVRFAGLISLVSRHVADGALEPGEELLARAEGTVPGWTPERWTVREAARVRLVLARADLAEETFATDLEDAFRYADEGELRALYKSLCLLPDNGRFAWRAGEGCRTNIVPVFEAVACDTPFPAEAFDDVAFRQLAIKALFIGAPLYRVHGLDGRLDEELARMALDLVDERTSAGRPIPPELWACLGRTADPRALVALQRELEGTDPHALRGACLGLARAGQISRLEELTADASRPLVAAAAVATLAGPTDISSFRSARPEDA